MTADAVKRAIESAAREAFRLGRAAAGDRGQSARFQEQATTYAVDLVLPMVKLATDEAREQGWIGAYGERDASDGPT